MPVTDFQINFPLPRKHYLPESSQGTFPYNCPQPLSIEIQQEIHWTIPIILLWALEVDIALEVMFRYPLNTTIWQTPSIRLPLLMHLPLE